MPDHFATVALPLPVHGTFTYSIPDDLKDEVRFGCRVEVPWGRKLATGFVTGFTNSVDVAPEKLRAIRSVLDPMEPALTEEIVQLCAWASTYSIAPLGEMLRVALPPNMTAQSRRRVTPATGIDHDTSLESARGMGPRELEVFTAVSTGTSDFGELSKQFRGAAGAMIRLRDAGLVNIVDVLSDAKGVRFDRFVTLLKPVEELPSGQQAIVDALEEAGGEMRHLHLLELGLSASSVSTLERKGIVSVEKRPRRHSLGSFATTPHTHGELEYSDEQNSAIAEITASLGTFTPFLLQGITGSGKTEVYIELMREVVRRGEQAILLVPEISLTPVFAARLEQRFGDRVAILHSNLSASEKYDQWWRARRGLVDVAIGPRSALFTPFPKLGLIVVDEEGDSAYKQEESPRYNARDLAVVRARGLSIPVILGSATPSLETRENAARGRYRMIRLASRIGSQALPDVDIVDIRKEKGEKEDRGLVIFGSRLLEELGEVFGRGEQAIILINRRGYAPFLLCRECENDFRCRDCSVTLTVHRNAGLLMCHYCGLRGAIPLRCPECKGEVLQPIGFGTEKVEERFRQHFPEVTADVIDRDSTRRKGSLVKILERFRTGETKALIGTQIISKGHHFPNVTLTAVINADSILGYPDFRSAEKTFSLLTQVAGRAGRGKLRGRVVIQSGFPTHYALQLAARHDYEGFFSAEIEFRKRFHYPPFTSMIALLFRGEDAEFTESMAIEAGRRLEAEVAAIRDIRIQGPAPAPLAKIKGVFRYQILLRSSHRTQMRKAVERVMLSTDFRGADFVIDVDPINML